MQILFDTINLDYCNPINISLIYQYSLQEPIQVPLLTLKRF